MCKGICILRLITFSILPGLLSTLPTEATTLTVGGGGYPTIQGGLDAAVTGDTVLVLAGIWSGAGNRDLDFAGKALVLRSFSGPETTVIDCGGSDADPHRGIYFHSGEFGAEVEGFTIRNAVVTGGFYAGTGAGIRITGNAIVNIRDSRIVGNRCAGDAAGGAIGIDGGGVTRAIITACVLSGNSAATGGGVSCISTFATITDCLITGNFGGGLFIDGPAVVTVNGTTITRNRAESIGGGLFSISNAFVQFNRSIIWGNCAPNFANEIYVQSSGTFNFDYCDVDTLPSESFYDGTATHSYEVTIASDPLFCGPGACLSIPSSEGDYGLAPGSPCLPAATGGYLIGARGEGCAVLSVNPDAGGPERIQLSPNPARGKVTVYFQAGPGRRPRIIVHDLEGRKIRQVRPEFSEGAWTWDGLDASGRRVAPGAYFIRLEGSARPAVRQVVLVP